MAPTRPDRPTEAEWRILKIVHEHGTCAAREVIAVAAAHWSWSASTVKTLLRRLVDKGHLSARAVGSSLLYRPKGSIQRSLRESADRLIDQTVDGAMGPLLQYMVKKSRLSERDLEALRELIDEQRGKKERP